MEKEEFNKELELAQKMKYSYCINPNGTQFKETKPEKAAEIIHEIGLIYRKKSPDKVSLIQSVGLMNAAIARKPSNVFQIESDLEEICQHILKTARALNQNADLINAAKKIKNSITKLRDETVKFLESPDAQKIPDNVARKQLQQMKTSKISAICQVNKTIAKEYKRIMASLSEFCENVMGKPPCDYAIVGMGSLARTEITPYSDFEHVILLFDHENYSSHLEYFRWYSVIFHVIVLNCRETIIPSLNIKCLNNKESILGDWYFDIHTTRGISFDGMMPHACKFPLGKTQHTKNKPFETELIKPVTEMLKCLSSEADLKNGYHLADILTKTCFVFGSNDIFELFENGVKKYLESRSQLERIEEVKQQVQDDLNNFSTRFHLAKLKTYDTINIKQLVYRSTTIFITALARINNISANSCFDIVNELENMKVVSQNTRDKIHYAIAIACEMRLRVYSSKQSQCDNAIDLKQDSKNIMDFLNIVGVASTINYFQIAYCLQCEVAKQLNFTKLHFYSDPQLINFTIGLTFGINNLKANVSQDHLKVDWDLSSFNFDACIEQLELLNSIETDYKLNTTDWALFDMHTMKSVAEQLYKNRKFDEALEFYQQLLLNYKNQSWYESKDIALTYVHCGLCLKSLGQFQNAFNTYNKALEIFQKTSPKPQVDRNIASLLGLIGNCLMKAQRNEIALFYLKQSLEVSQNTSTDHYKDRYIAIALNRVGKCLRNMHQLDDALSQFKQAHEIFQTTSLNPRKDLGVATTLNNISGCLLEMNRYDDAFKHVELSFEIKLNVSIDPKKDGDIASSLTNIGRCLKYNRKYNNALIFLEQSLKILQSLPVDPQNDIKLPRLSI